MLAKVEKLEAELTELRSAPVQKVAQNSVQPQAMQTGTSQPAVQPNNAPKAADANAVAKLNVQGVEIEVFDTNTLLSVIQQLKG